MLAVVCARLLHCTCLEMGGGGMEMGGGGDGDGRWRDVDRRLRGGDGGEVEGWRWRGVIIYTLMTVPLPSFLAAAYL